MADASAKWWRAFRRIFEHESVGRGRNEGRGSRPRLTFAQIMEALAASNRQGRGASYRGILPKHLRRPKHVRAYLARFIALGVLRVDVAPDGTASYSAEDSLYGLQPKLSGRTVPQT